MPTLVSIFVIYTSRAFQNTKNFEDRPSRTRVRDENIFEIFKSWLALSTFERISPQGRTFGALLSTFEPYTKRKKEIRPEKMKNQLLTIHMYVEEFPTTLGLNQMSSMT